MPAPAYPLLLLITCAGQAPERKARSEKKDKQDEGGQREIAYHAHARHAVGL
jgi:hypothetical protein